MRSLVLNYFFRTLLVFFGLCFSCSTALAATLSKSISPESDTTTTLANGTCFLHLDKGFYVTGEIMWYKLYLTPEFEGTPVIIKANLYTHEGSVIDNFFIKTEGKVFVDGYYKIPYNFSSGNYILNFTTLIESGLQVTRLAETAIPIYNDLEGVAQLISNSSGSGSGKSDLVEPQTGELMVSIQLPQNSISARDKVEPVISIRDKAGNPVKASLSVSVIDWQLAGSGQLNSAVQGAALENIDVSRINNQIYLVGEVKKDTEEAFEVNVLGAYSRDEEQVYFTRSNAEGRFFLAIPDFYGERPLQFLGLPANYKKIKVSQTPLTAPTLQPGNQLPFNYQIANYLDLSRQRKKIFQYYTSLEANIQIKEYDTDLKPLKPEASYITKEYEDFEFMYIFFKENLTQLRFQFQRDSTYQARMLNPKSRKIDNYFRDPPLFIIDGIATREADFVARMRMEDIEKVEIFYNIGKLNRQYKIFGSSGLVKIKTYDAIENIPVYEASNILQIDGLQKEASFPFFDPAGIGQRQPFFRPQLYWNPDLASKADGNASFSYFQSDDKSTFQIMVVAQSETGEIGIGTVRYEVQD